MRTGAARWSPAVKGLVAITLLAAALRIATVSVQSAWLDETATMLLVHRSFAGMLSHLAASESTPPLYYVLVWGWTRLFGAGVVAFRSFSVLVGTLTVPVAYLAGRRVSTRVGLWAATLAAVNPAMYYYSQEARAYALLILFSAAAFAVWQRALQSPTARRIALWCGLSVLALLSHYFALFLFLPEALLLVWRVGWRRTWPALTIVSAVVIALAPLAAAQHSNARKSQWIEQTSLPSRALETAKLFLVGVYGPLELLSAALAGALTLAALTLIRRASNEARRVAADAAIVGAIALVVPLLGAATHVLDVFDGRNVIATWVVLCVLVAIGLGARADTLSRALGAGLCAVSLAVIAGINALPAYQRDDWRGAAHALAPFTGERVLVAGEYASIPLSVYLHHVRAIHSESVATGEIDFIGLRTKGANGGAPLRPYVPTRPPPGFRLVSVRKAEAYAVSRFRAVHPTSVSAASLRHLSGEAGAQVLRERSGD